MEQTLSKHIIENPLAIVSGSKTWNACLYVRISREDGDKNESDSITNQKTLIHSYATSLSDVNIIEEFVDDGFSGACFERPSVKRHKE